MYLNYSVAHFGASSRKVLESFPGQFTLYGPGNCVTQSLGMEHVHNVAVWYSGFARRKI